jgi:hypothetical protein
MEIERHKDSSGYKRAKTGIKFIGKKTEYLS